MTATQISFEISLLIKYAQTLRNPAVIMTEAIRQYELLSISKISQFFVVRKA